MEPRNIDNTHEITGQVDYAIKKKYRWISESGKNTCEKCKSLDGKVFDLKDLPKRPHPNCKCRVEEISVVEGAVAKLYGYRDEKFNLEIDAKEILGDLSVIRAKINAEFVILLPEEISDKKQELLDDIERLIIEVNRYIETLSELNRYSNENLFWQKSNQLTNFRSEVTRLNSEFERLKERRLELRFDRIAFDKMNKMTQDLIAVENELYNKFVNYLEQTKEKIIQIPEVQATKKYLDEYKELNLFLASMKAITDGLVYANRKYEDAAGLWVLESSNFTRGLDYLNKNGKLIEHISDLNNPELEKIVTKKCATQNFNTDDPKGIIFHKDSSIAKSIVTSIDLKQKLKQIITNNISNLVLNNEKIDKISFDFKLRQGINNFASMHLCDIYNLKIKNKYVKMTLLDTVDYNDWKVFAPKALQDAGIIKNYYFIIEIEIPLNEVVEKIE